MEDGKFIRTWLPAFLTTFIVSFLLVGIFGFWGVGWLSKITGGNSKYINFYFNYENAFHPESGDMRPGFDHRLVLVDANMFHMAGHGDERAAVATLLDTLYRLRPAVIGLDLLFPNSLETTMEEDSKLEETVRNCKDRLVVAARNHIEAGGLYHSFFTLSTGVDYGTVNGQDFYVFAAADQIDDSTKVEKLVVKLARKGGFLKGEVPQGLVDYTSKNCQHRIFSSPEFLTEANIKDKLVLVGEFGDSRDYVNLPFRIDGESTLPGSTLLAYQLSSLISQDGMIQRAGMGANLLWNFIFLLGYSLVFVLLSIRENQWVDNEAVGLFCKRKSSSFGLNAFFLFIKPLFLLLASALCIIFCCWYIRHEKVMLDMLIFFVGEILVIDFSTKFFIMSFNKRFPKVK